MFNNSNSQIIKNDPNLVQGRHFLNLQKEDKKNLASNLSLIKKTSSSNVGSIIEALQNNNSTQSKETIHMENMSNTEIEFNKTLMEYSNTHKLIVTELTNNNINNKNLTKYFGRNLKNDGEYYYVNDYGYTHKFSNSAWSNRPENCSSKLTSIGDDIFSKLKKADPMGVGQACKIAGNNIQNKLTLERAWVDIKGQKHIYTDSLWNKKNLSCELNPIIIDNSEYINIPVGEPMSNGMNCSKMEIDPKLLKKLENLNNKLIVLAKQLLAETQNLSVTDKNLSDELDSLKDSVSKRLKIHENNKKNINNGKILSSQDLNSIRNRRKDTYSQLQSNYNKYYYLLILTFLFILFLIHNYSSSQESQLLQILLLVGSMYLLYKILNYFIKNLL